MLTITPIGPAGGATIEGVEFDGCSFERLDGNALFVSGYNRYATVKDS